MIENTDIRDLRYNLFLNSDDYILIIGADRKKKLVNKAYLDLWRSSEEDQIGQDYTHGFAEDRARWYESQIQSMTPQAPSVSFTIKSGPENYKEWVQWKATGLFDADGCLVEVMVVGRNVNDTIAIKQDREKLFNTLTAFKTAIDSHIICTITDEKGVINYANRNFCAISKYTQREVHGKTHSIINSGHHPRAFFANMWRTISSGRMWTGEIKNVAKDGSIYWVNSVIIPIKDTRRRISGYLSLRVLINKRKEMEEDRKIYQKSLEQMLFMVSHEIRRPIATLQGLLYLLQDEQPADPVAYQEYISYLTETAGELNDYSYKLNDYLEQHVTREPLSVSRTRE